MKAILELWTFRQLIRQLAARDLKARYKVSILGFFWSLLRPLLTILVLAAVFSMLDFQSVRYELSYPTLLLASYIPWFFFSTTLLEGTHSLLGNANLIKKVYSPRAVYPTAVVLANLINFLFAMVVLIPILFCFTQAVPTFFLLQLPLVIAMHALLTLGICYAVSALNVLYRDTTQIMEFLVFIWFYVTPVLYDTAEVFKSVPKWATYLYMLNPMVGMIEWYRLVLLNSAFIDLNQVPDSQQAELLSQGITPPVIERFDLLLQVAIPWAILCSLLFVCLGYGLFKKIETRVVDTI